MILTEKNKLNMKNFNNFEIGKKYIDEFGRVSGIFPYFKKKGEFSHDIVYKFRRELETKKVGHAGALDPFAEGVLIILAGKATKLSDKFLNLDKEYIAEIGFGISSESLDPESKIEFVEDFEINKDSLIHVLNSFIPEYVQDVPIYSSVKVQGRKLRELARKNDYFKIREFENKKYVGFYKNNKLSIEFVLPSKIVKIYEIELISINKTYINEIDKNIPTAIIKVKCSKGTYVRKLGEDIGKKMGVSSILINLKRTKVGDITVEDSWL